MPKQSAPQEPKPKLTPEQRAAISRANGAKSRGPKTDAGKQRSARNAIKTGEHAGPLAYLVPPHAAVLYNEDRQAYYRLFDEMLHIYQPRNQEAANLVKQITIARWEIERLNLVLTMTWNAAILDAGTEPPTVPEEMAEYQTLIRAHLDLFGARQSAVQNINRQIDRLERRIDRLRRAIRDVHTHFPNVAPEPKPKPAAASTEKSGKRTQPPQPANVENKEDTPQPAFSVKYLPDPSEPPLYVTEHDEMVLQAYRREFPGRRIVLLPPDDVALGRVSDDDDLPYVPRRAA
jgi:hypothetical protein